MLKDGNWPSWWRIVWRHHHEPRPRGRPQPARRVQFSMKQQSLLATCKIENGWMLELEQDSPWWTRVGLMLDWKAAEAGFYTRKKTATIMWCADWVNGEPIRCQRIQSLGDRRVLCRRRLRLSVDVHWTCKRSTSNIKKSTVHSGWTHIATI